MKRVSTVELIRNFSAHGDAALAGPVIITKNGRDRLVLISIEQYNLYEHVFDAHQDASQPRRGRQKPAGGRAKRTIASGRAR
jgi:PHD/YefM family antitoxin component YafN of YafNO toxin-antitoxin module